MHPSAPGFGDEVPSVVAADLHQFMMDGCAVEAYENGFACVDDCWRWCQYVETGDDDDWERNIMFAVGAVARPCDGFSLDSATTAASKRLGIAAPALWDCRI